MILTRKDTDRSDLSAASLLALDAVAIDTETSGLDARNARIVQIGAVRVRGGKLDDTATFDRLINPGIRIPAAAIAIHGIDDQRVRDAPTLAAVALELESFLGSAVLVGHTIAYDLAVLKREHDLAGRSWTPRRALDVRLLAEFVWPTLAQYDLERLAQHLEVELAPRHTALGDAVSAARIFSALLPSLRDRGVRTLAEAEATCRRVAERSPYSAGTLIGQNVVPDVRHARSRLDSFAYRHRVRDVMSAPAVMAPATANVQETIRLLLERRISSVFVDDGSGELGIVTERDLLRAIDGIDTTRTTLGDLMSRPLHAVAEDDFIYRAIGRMNRLGIRHLGVRNAYGELTGAVTTRNLLRDRATGSIELGDEVDSAREAPELARAWSKLPSVVRGLIEDAVDPYTIAAVISSEICMLTRRAAELAELRMIEDGKGGPPANYALLVLGSAGRGESLLAADQDNAIVYEAGAPGGAIDSWFESLGGHIADTLDQAGVPYCKGGVMAKNAQWRMSAAAWNETIGGWVRRQRPQDLLNVDIFFDAIPVHGRTELGEAIWNKAYALGHANPSFIMLLTELARDWRSPLTFLGNIRFDATGRSDLKKGGLMPLFTSARVLSIRHDIRTRSTAERFRGAAKAGAGDVEEIEAIVAAHRTILGAILEQQLADIAAGIPPTAKVEKSRLDKRTRVALQSALGRVSSAIDLISEGRF